MRQNDLRPPKGARHKPKRIGRGYGSGHGGYATRGIKGQKARAGGGVRPGFEGGQTPLSQRLPRKRGFTNIFRVEYALVKVEQLASFEAGSEVTPQSLHAAGVIKNTRKPVKILGDGALTVPLTVKANKFSAAAKAKIEQAGGRAEELALAGATSIE